MIKRLSLLRAGLMSEALAFVDLLVLTRARHFTGLIESSFSWVVRVRHEPYETA